MILAILGGDSVSTPLLIEEIASERLGLPDIEIRLHGRNRRRLEGIRDYARQRAKSIRISCHTDVREAARYSSSILCQVRPGGMSGRGADERLALQYGTPADEGLGLGGLLAYLRGRPVIERLLSDCAAVSTSAHVFMLTSPLGPMTWLANRYFPGRSYGVCELPAITARAVCARAAEAGWMVAAHDVAGVNHCSWLYNFQDGDGRDLTEQVLRCLTTDILGFDAGIAVDSEAVPVHYLRLFLETEKVVHEQQAVTETRGEHLVRWRREADRLLTAAFIHPDAIEKQLALRRNNWYRYGVVPALAALSSKTLRRTVLNVPNEGLLPKLPSDMIVEATCMTGERGIERTALPQLPAKPLALTQRLIEYERRLIDLPESVRPSDLAEVLQAHPLLEKLPRSRVTRDVVDRINEEEFRFPKRR